MAQEQTRDQQRNMIMDCIIAHFAGQRIDAMDVSRTVRERYGIRIDWHIASDVLDRLERHGQITRSGTTFDRMAAYTII